MEEYDEFASDDFDVKGWINATVASHLQLLHSSGRGEESNGHASAPISSLANGAGNGLDTHLSGVATKLQAVSSSINAGLEKSMVEIMVSVPRVVTEIERVEGAIKILHSELRNLTGQLDEIDLGTNAHVETLARLDLVKTNMGDCLHTLTEAASWNALVREVNAKFGQDDLKGVAERLEAMVKSMDVLKDMPEAEDRATTLKELQERLETLLKPKLLQVLKKNRVGLLMEYAAMYRQLGRTDRFRGEYCRARAGVAHRRWFASATSSSCGTGVGVILGGSVVREGGSGEDVGAAGNGLATWLPPFLEYLQGSLMDERKKTSDLFGPDKSPAVLCELVVTAFQSLVGSFQKHLEAAPWPDAVGLLTEVLRFVSQSLELSRGAGERDLLAVLLSATAAFRSAQDSFGAFERSYLSAELQPLLETLRDVPRVLGDGSTAMAMAFTRRMEEISEVSTEGFGVVQQAVGRCIELTAGYQGRDLLKHAAESMSGFLKAVRGATQQSRSLGKGVLIQSTLEEYDGAPSYGDEDGHGTASDVSAEAFAKGRGGDFDWQFLSGALVLLGAAGRCQQCFATLEKEIATVLLRHRGALFSSSPPRLSGLVLPPNASISSSGIFGKGVGTLGTAAASGISVGVDGGSEEERVAFLRSVLGRARLEEDRATRAETRASLMVIADPSSALPGDVLPGPWRDLKALALEAQSLVFDVCFAPVTSRLATVPSLSSWTEGGEEDTGGGWEQGDGSWDYDTVPQAYMTQVGEHLLSLLQNLEPFASSDAFQDAVEPSQDLHLLTEPAWREFGAVLELDESELTVLETLCGAKPAEDGLGHHPLRGDDRADPGDEEHTGEPEDTEAARFCTAWLLCIGSGTVGCLLAKVLALPRLSQRGVKHLEADLKYLSNVFHALDLSAPPILERVTSLAELGTEDAYSHLAQETVAGFGSAGAILMKLERRLAEVRGITSAA